MLTAKLSKNAGIEAKKSNNFLFLNVSVRMVVVDEAVDRKA
ncbi:hypothetical protein [Paenibacillus sp. SYP-B3998]|nr:hypothetical protein [Paenibacillus sp. SYP-B3998]